MKIHNRPRRPRNLLCEPPALSRRASEISSAPKPHRHIDNLLRRRLTDPNLLTRVNRQRPARDLCFWSRGHREDPAINSKPVSRRRNSPTCPRCRITPRASCNPCGPSKAPTPPRSMRGDPPTNPRDRARLTVMHLELRLLQELDHGPRMSRGPIQLSFWACPALSGIGGR